MRHTKRANAKSLSATNLPTMAITMEITWASSVATAFPPPSSRSLPTGLPASKPRASESLRLTSASSAAVAGLPSGASRHVQATRPLSGRRCGVTRTWRKCAEKRCQNPWMERLPILYAENSLPLKSISATARRLVGALLIAFGAYCPVFASGSESRVTSRHP